MTCRDKAGRFTAEDVDPWCHCAEPDPHGYPYRWMGLHPGQCRRCEQLVYAYLAAAVGR